jgi:aconitase A
LKHGVKSKAAFNVTPGSEQIRATIERDGIVRPLKFCSHKILIAVILTGRNSA